MPPKLNPAPHMQSADKATLAAHAVFVPTGIMNVLLGPLLPTLAARWTINDTQSGDLFFAQFLTSTLGVLISGFLVPRHGYRFAIALGLLSMAAGLAVLPFVHWPAGLLVVASWGFGFGVTIPACNLLVADLQPERQAAALNLLNFSWSAGAVACPFLLAPFARARATDLFLLLLAACIVCLTIALGAVVFPRTHLAGGSSTHLGPSLRRLLFSRVAFVLAVLFFLYTGAENAVGGWLASYAKRTGSEPGSLWVTAPSFFYLALLVGRAAAPLALRKLRDITLARTGLALAAFGVLALLLSSFMSGILASAFAVGLGLAAVYPITISRMARTAGALAPQMGSVMFGLAGVGAACGPWLVGFASTQLSSLKLGLIVPLVGSVLMLILYLRRWEREPVRPSAAADPELIH
jgi:FHS family glucose/mannose:H+ symporter-like MFS transporter